MKKKQILSNIAFCLSIAVVVACVFVAYASGKDGKYPFDKEIVMAKHNDVKIQKIDEIKANSNGEITIDQLSSIPDNALLGEIKYKDSSIQIIYNCNDVSLIETATLLKNGDYIGEIGDAKIYGYRENMAVFMSLPVGDIIKISMPYGEYEYKCIEKTSASNEWDASRLDFETSRGLILFSDKADEYGFSGQYDVAVFEMVSGPKVIG